MAGIVYKYTAINLFSFPKFSFDNTSYDFNFAWGGTIRKCNVLLKENFVHAEIPKLHAHAVLLYIRMLLCSMYTNKRMSTRDKLSIIVVVTCYASRSIMLPN